MDFTDFQTGKDDTGRRLDKVIRIFIPDLPLSNIYQSMRKGLVKVNGKKTKPDYRIVENDVISVADILLGHEQKSENTHADTGSIKIENLIVFENDDILILNKPEGINVHKAKKNEISLAQLVETYYKRTRSCESLSFRPGPLHRLDKMTKGLVCFSMSLKCAKWFGEQMEAHKIKKTYYATVEGRVEETVKWNDYILKEDENGDDFHTVKVIDGNTKDIPADAKECITTIIPLEIFTNTGNVFTRCEFQIETGRQHQIRAQSAFHGHPLAGDTAYGTTVSALPFDLRAFKLEFSKNDMGIPKNIVLTNPFEK